jgi:arabinogalactan endo-1,4-beta-galactosidase
MGTLTITINGKTFEDDFDSLEELNGFYLAARVLLEKFNGESVSVQYRIEYNGGTFGHTDNNQKKNLSVLIPIQVSIYRMRLRRLTK